jgi:hypothetical protein
MSTASPLGRKTMFVGLRSRVHDILPMQIVQRDRDRRAERAISSAGIGARSSHR